MPVHSHDNDQILNPMQISPYAGNVSGLTQIYLKGDLLDKKYEVPLIIMVVFLSFMLFCMIVSMLLPSGLYSLVSCICQSRESGRKGFNYIDAALYKTRHTMYRKEVYCQQMRKSLLGSATAVVDSNSPSNKDTELQEITTNSCEPIPSTSVSKSHNTISHSTNTRPPIKIINASQSDHRDVCLLTHSISRDDDILPIEKRELPGKYLKTPSVSFNSSFDNSITTCVSEPGNTRFSRRQLSQESSPLLNSPEEEDNLESVPPEPQQTVTTTLKSVLRKHQRSNYPTAVAMSVDSGSCKLVPQTIRHHEPEPSTSIVTTSVDTAGYAPVTQSRRAKRMLTRWSTCDSDKRDSDHRASNASIMDL